MRSVLLRNFKQFGIVVSHRRFGTSYLSHFQGRRSSSWTHSPLKMGPLCCPETSVGNCYSTLSKTPPNCADLVNCCGTRINSVCISPVSHATYAGHPRLHDFISFIFGKYKSRLPYAVSSSLLPLPLGSNYYSFGISKHQHFDDRVPPQQLSVLNCCVVLHSVAIRIFQPTNPPLITLRKFMLCSIKNHQ
jgi:hypothetical protein